MENNHLFCFGLGYVATKFADDLLSKGWRVSGTCRTTEKFPHLKTLGITPYLFDEYLPLEGVWDLNSVTHIVVSIPPGADGDVVLNQHIDDLRNIPNLKWIGYLSTTGVYGDYKGGWVDETSQTKPDQDRLKNRIKAEEEWLSSGLPVNIFRLSGIYGKGRNVIDSLKSGTAKRIQKENQFFNRIHVEDISQILQASIKKEVLGQVYNCSDDLPAAQGDVVEYAANLIGFNPPELIRFEDADLSDMARSFYSASRKVSNQKIKDELGVGLIYPTYEEGLSGCL